MIKPAILRGVVASSAHRSAVVTPVDPYWGDTLISMPFNGSFNDLKGHSTVAASGVTLDYSNFFSPPSSAKFDGTGAVQVTLNGNDAAFASGDFTIEGFLSPTDLSANSGLFFFGDPDSNYNRVQIDYKTNGSVSFFIEGSADGLTIDAQAPAGTIVVGNRYHIAAVVSGNVLILFIDGVETGRNTGSVRAANHNANCYIGLARNGGARRYCTGIIDDFRLTKGVARYTSNFKTPTPPFPTS